MNKNDWKRKLTSRKLWVAVVGVIVGVSAAFGIEDNDYTTIAGIVTAAASVVAYIFGESKIDAANSVPININFGDESTFETSEKDAQ